MRKPVFRAPESMSAGRGIDPAVWAFIREDEDAPRTAGREENAFRCERCGEAVPQDGNCVVFRMSESGPRRCFCSECAEAADTLGGHLELLGIPFFSGRADSGEAWLSMRR